MHGTRASLEKSNGSFARAKPTAQRLKKRAQRCPEKSAPPPLEHARALKRYLCLFLEEGQVARHQLTLRSDLSDDARAGVMGLFHGARVMAFAVDKTTVPVAAGVPMSRALAEFARGYGVLGKKLQARLKKDFGTARPSLSPDEQQRMILLDRALAVVTRVDLPPARAFASAGFDLATIYSSPQSP
jgi:hypothetical protein